MARRLLAIAFAIAIGLLGACAVALTPGCAWLRGQCTAALPTISQVQSYAQDASIALNGLEATLAQIHVDAATEAEIKSDLDRARKALQTVADAAATAADVCATPNILALFADFEQIWTDIEALITNAHVLMAMPAGARPPGVQVPAVVTLIRRSR